MKAGVSGRQGGRGDEGRMGGAGKITFYFWGNQVLLCFFKLKKKPITTLNSPRSVDIFSDSVVTDPSK